MTAATLAPPAAPEDGPRCAGCGRLFSAQEARAGFDRCEHCPDGVDPAHPYEFARRTYTPPDEITVEVDPTIAVAVGRVVVDQWAFQCHVVRALAVVATVVLDLAATGG